MDRGKIEALYRDYGPMVYRRARNILRNEEDAQEAMQDVFITALTKGDSFRGESATTTWLYSVTTNLCLNRLRNKKRRTELVSNFNPRAWSKDLPHPELVQIVHSVLRSVPQKLAQVAVYYYFDDMTHEEISDILGCSRRKVGYLLSRFQKELEKQEAQK